ncbi:2-dehydropantoate 2-reductase [Cohnella sp. LGH]|uniref:ketopantoate reductase family protein n=1 Tax=Cohnella sp. LGH TaxID=1619153 RepID=UPI001ADBDAC3|nr:2-dehydropantoate 2-reductase [Cohnella sp. LGH]QTH46110.1 2-dehydropantoate 2-reductase [Cohnella sp. LGH]
MDEKTVVLGGGSLGLLLAGKLYAAGRECVVWTRTREQAERLNAEGLALEETGGGERLLPAFACAWENAEPIDGIVLLAVKQTALAERFLARLFELVAPGGTVVAFQNGIGHIEALRDALPDREIVAAVTTEGALRVNGARVRHTGSGDIRLGDDGHTRRERLQAVERMLTEGGFSVFLSKQLNNEMMRKLLINAVINPLTAILRIPNGEIANSPDRLELARALFRETHDVLGAYGLEGEAADLWNAILRVGEATAGNRSSMLQDVEAGRETEVEAINGMIVRMAIGKGLDAPWNRMATALVKALK